MVRIDWGIEILELPSASGQRKTWEIYDPMGLLSWTSYLLYNGLWTADTGCSFNWILAILLISCIIISYVAGPIEAALKWCFETLEFDI